MWRDRLACLTCKTHAVVKAVGTWAEAVTVALVEHNWLRPHAALRQRLPEAVVPGGRRSWQQTPARAFGLTDHVWSWAEFLSYPVLQDQRGDYWIAPAA